MINFSLLDITDDGIWIKWLEILLGSCSLAGSIIIIITFLTNLNKTSPAFELILHISIATLINAISHLILYIPPGNDTYNAVTCKIQGFLMIFSELCTMIIASTISFYIWKTKAEIIINDRFNCKKRLFYLAFIYLIPLIFTTICYEYIGENGRWCWIAEDYTETIGLADYITIWILISINLTFACLAKKIKLENFHDEEIKNRKNYINQLSYYPIISLCCWIPATVHRVINMYEEACETNLALTIYFQVLSNSFILIQGILYSIVSFRYIFTGKDIKTFLKSFFCFCFSCCRKKKIVHDPSDDISQYLSNFDKRFSMRSKNSCIAEDRLLPVVNSQIPKESINIK